MRKKLTNRKWRHILSTYYRDETIKLEKCGICVWFITFEENLKKLVKKYRTLFQNHNEILKSRNYRHYSYAPAQNHELTQFRERLVVFINWRMIDAQKDEFILWFCFFFFVSLLFSSLFNSCFLFTKSIVWKRSTGLASRDGGSECSWTQADK